MSLAENMIKWMTCDICMDVGHRFQIFCHNQGHSFCPACTSALRKTQSRCPICRSSSVALCKVIIDGSRQRIVSDLRAHFISQVYTDVGMGCVVRVDAVDKEQGRWYEADISLEPPNVIRLHFLGWGSNFDETVSLPATHFWTRILPVSTKTCTSWWLAHLKHGQSIEFLLHKWNEKRKWYRGTISFLSTSGKFVHVIVADADNKTLKIKRNLEHIAPIGTHVRPISAEK